MKRMKLIGLMLAAAVTVGGISVPDSAKAADYVVDTEGAHAFISFRVSHLGYSFVHGRFDRFTGNFNFDDKDPAKSKIVIDIETASVNTNHGKRDKHIRNDDFLNVDKFPTAKFESTAITLTGEQTAKIKGNLTLMGLTREIVIDAQRIGGGPDPWGGFRQGFTGTTSINMSDYPMKKDYGKIEFDLVVEGIRK